MNFIILGAGTVGCYLGGRLAASGRRVTLVGRPRVIDAISAGGLTVSDVDGFKAHLPARQLTLATSLASVRMETPHVLLLCARNDATESAALEISACCPASTPVISLQNGVGHAARIRAIAPRMRVMAGLLACSVMMPAPGALHRASAGYLYLERGEFTQDMSLLLDTSGIETALVRDMRALQWGALLLNLHNPVNASSDLPLRAQLMDRDYRRVLANLQQEALAVMHKARIRPASVTGVPARLLPHLLRSPNWLFSRLAARLLRMDDSARSSMWDDAPHDRSAAIQDLCGAVVHLAARHGLQAPRNAAMCELIAAQRKGWRLSGPEMRKTAAP